MTISYAGEVPNGSSFGCFWRILLKWRGSVYKLVWRELLAYLTLYYTINLIYRFGLSEEHQRIFEKVRQYFGAQSESIPMSFVLGFYVSLVVKRWWEQYKLLPWPDTLALFISAGIPGAVRHCFIKGLATLADYKRFQSGAETLRLRGEHDEKTLGGKVAHIRGVSAPR